eukprot:TRINITY_DN847_c0_g1_i3.p1 TRINITY_DN847_c0_g1~~TRINITY_DN847_c0_g1_i3.p1  ORF type:complete len:429 (-),score=57.41 TRINITY_DN847_c0_g1_i3:317-1603(-)
MESSQRSRHSSSRPSSSRRNVSCVPTLRTCEIYGPVEDWDQVGEGTFGEVFKARDSQTDDMVALKKIRMRNEREGFPITAIREIKLLRDLHHENVIDLREVVSSKEEDKGRKGDVYIVFEFMDHDLMGLMDTAQLSSVQSNTPTGFPLPMIKCFAKQLLSGLHYCHKRNIMHRDIKGANLLITNSGVLKLGDFGLSRTFAANDPSYKYTNRVVTLWYRAPELLLGATQYGPEIDNWSAGCIVAELLLGNKALFPGQDEKDQMDKVERSWRAGYPVRLCRYSPSVALPQSSAGRGSRACRTTGSSTQRSCTQTACAAPCAGIALVVYSSIRCCGWMVSHCVVVSLKEDSVDLLCKLLTLDPPKRISAQKALDHDWFWNDPMPCDPSRLADHNYASSHEFVTKKRRNERRKERTTATAAEQQNGDKRQRR